MESYDMTGSPVGASVGASTEPRGSAGGGLGSYASASSLMSTSPTLSQGVLGAGGASAGAGEGGAAAAGEGGGAVSATPPGVRAGASGSGGAPAGTPTTGSYVPGRAIEDHLAVPHRRRGRGARGPGDGDDDDVLGDAARVSVCYADYFGLWPALEPAIRSHMPLRNLAWKFRGGSTNFHTIDALDVAWVPQGDPSFDFERTAVNWYRAPYGFAFLVKCERPEDYKTAVRPLLKSWVESMVERRAEWLIIYLPLGAASDVPDVKVKGYRKVLDKLKSDFSTRRDGDRIVRIDLYPPPASAAAAAGGLSGAAGDVVPHRQWDVMLDKLAHAIVNTLSARSTDYEEEVRRRYEQHTLPGWNFATYFCVKESLAHMYQQMNLLEETLRQYDELEATFYVAASQGSVAGAEYVAGLHNRAFAVGDDSGHVLDIDRKPFREMIHSNRISLMDFRQYLFARQCHLLFALERPVVVATRAMAFIQSFAESLAHQVAEGWLARPLSDSWVYSACVDVAEMCQEHSPSLLPRHLRGGTMSSREDVALLACTLGSLYLMARERLASIRRGVAWVHAPTTKLATWSPLSNCLTPGGAVLAPLARASEGDGVPAAGQDSSSSGAGVAAAGGETVVPGGGGDAEETGDFVGPEVTANPTLQHALRSFRGYEELYLAVTKAACHHFQHAGRLRFAARLQSEMAAIYLLRGEYSAVRPLLGNEAARYWQDDWKALYVHVLTHIALCNLQLGRHDQYVSDCLRITDPTLRAGALEALAQCGRPEGTVSLSVTEVNDSSAGDGGVGDDRSDIVLSAAERTACLRSFVADLERVARLPGCREVSRDLRPSMDMAIAVAGPPAAAAASPKGDDGVPGASGGAASPAGASASVTVNVNARERASTHRVGVQEDFVVTVRITNHLPADVTADSVWVEMELGVDSDDDDVEEDARKHLLAAAEAAAPVPALHSAARGAAGDSSGHGDAIESEGEGGAGPPEWLTLGRGGVSGATAAGAAAAKVAGDPFVGWTTSAELLSQQTAALHKHRLKHAGHDGGHGAHDRSLSATVTQDTVAAATRTRGVSEPVVTKAAQALSMQGAPVPPPVGVWRYIRTDRRRRHALLECDVFTVQTDPGERVSLRQGATVLQLRHPGPLPGRFKILRGGLRIGSLTLAENDPLLLQDPDVAAAAALRPLRLRRASSFATGGGASGSGGGHNGDGDGGAGAAKGGVRLRRASLDSDQGSASSYAGDEPAREGGSGGNGVGVAAASGAAAVAAAAAASARQWRSVLVSGGVAPISAFVRAPPALVPGVRQTVQVLVRATDYAGAGLQATPLATVRSLAVHVEPHSAAVTANAFGATCVTFRVLGDDGSGAGAPAVRVTQAVTTNDIEVRELDDGGGGGGAFFFGSQAGKNGASVDVRAPPVGQWMLITVPVCCAAGAGEVDAGGDGASVGASDGAFLSGATGHGRAPAAVAIDVSVEAGVADLVSSPSPASSPRRATAAEAEAAAGVPEGPAARGSYGDGDGSDLDSSFDGDGSADAGGAAADRLTYAISDTIEVQVGGFMSHDHSLKLFGQKAALRLQLAARSPVPLRVLGCGLRLPATRAGAAAPLVVRGGPRAAAVVGARVAHGATMQWAFVLDRGVDAGARAGVGAGVATGAAAASGWDYSEGDIPACDAVAVHAAITAAGADAARATSATSNGGPAPGVGVLVVRYEAVGTALHEARAGVGARGGGGDGDGDGDDEGGTASRPVAALHVFPFAVPAARDVATPLTLSVEVPEQLAVDTSVGVTFALSALSLAAVKELLDGGTRVYYRFDGGSAREALSPGAAGDASSVVIDSDSDGGGGEYDEPGDGAGAGAVRDAAWILIGGIAEGVLDLGRGASGSGGVSTSITLGLAPLRRGSVPVPLLELRGPDDKVVHAARAWGQKHRVWVQ